MKLWSKSGTATASAVESFTVGKDKDFDAMLAPFDVLGSIAHTKMLAEVGLLSNAEAAKLIHALKDIYTEVTATDFVIPSSVEDIHSYVELLLTQRIGEAGKKIHSARSRNDQVLVDIKLFLRNEIKALVSSIQPFFELLQNQSETYKNHLLPALQLL